MVINRLSILVRVFISICLSAFSLAAFSADSEFLFSNDLSSTDRKYAPDILLSDINNRSISVSYEGKISLVHFWASWCLPCREELPLIEQLQNTYQDDPKFEIITVATDSHKNISTYLNRYKLNLTVVIDQYGKVMRRFKVQALPSSYLINNHGQIEYQATGAINWAHKNIKYKLDALLLESASK